jgi:hypothetical protein
MDNICNFCNKEFSCKVSLIRHQKTTKSCLQIQGKSDNDTIIECINCQKKLSFQSYKQHRIKCDSLKEYSDKAKLYDEIKEKYNIQLSELENLRELNIKYQHEISDLRDELKDERAILNKLRLEMVEYKSYTTILKEQNDKLTMKLAEKTTTVNNNNKTVVINAPLTNDVLRQCADTFTIDNAYNIKGITRHLTSSLEEHISCTDPSRNVFKYTNEKDEEIVDQNLEMLIPQYLTVIKDKNNFLYKEVFDYFKANNVSLSEQTDYNIFYNALNAIIDRKGEQNKYSEKYKQYIVRECKRQFLEKNKNREKVITRKLTDEEIMSNVIESGGNIYDYVSRAFPDYTDIEETDEQFKYRREMEDLFRQKKREWRMKHAELRN